MKYIIITFGSFFITVLATAQSVYTYSIPKIEGGTQALSTLQGKKLLIITLPTVQNTANDSLLHVIDSIGTANTGSLVIIGVPAYEDGYLLVRKNELKLWYQSILNAGIIVTDGLYTRKTAGTQQHPFFQWLTDKNKNGHFNEDVEGPMQKFIVWTDGELLGVLGAPSKLTGSAMTGLLQGQ